MQDARNSALSIVKGHRVAELMSIGEEIYDEYMAERIWPGTRALAQAHLDAGQKVWLVTAAPVETATIIARRLGLTGALGTVAESVGGVYTGKLVGEPLHGPAKAEAVRALAAAEGLDLARCAAYSDSANDIPMLSLVGHPYAINPDSQAAQARPRAAAGGCATTAPAARRPRSASRRRPASARWRAARRPRSPCTAAAARPSPGSAADAPHRHRRATGHRGRSRCLPPRAAPVSPVTPRSATTRPPTRQIAITFRSTSCSRIRYLIRHQPVTEANVIDDLSNWV